MRIAILTSLFPPKWLAGTEIATYNIAKQLAQKGHVVHIKFFYNAYQHISSFLLF